MSSKQVLPNRDLPWAIEWAGVVLLCFFESLRLKAYLCPAGKWTCGWGETEGVTPTTRWTKDYADRRLCDEIQRYADAVLAMCKVSPNDSQLAALVVLAYNIGLAGLQGSTVLKAHNRGDTAAAARAFALWNKATDPKTKKKVVLDGLVARRAKEAALYLERDEDDAPLPMPQAVDSESSMAASPINQASAISVVTAGVSALASLAPEPAPSAVDTVSSAVAVAKQAEEGVITLKGLAVASHDLLATVSGFLGVSPGVLLLASVVAGGVTIYWRKRQRAEGYA